MCGNLATLIVGGNKMLLFIVKKIFFANLLRNLFLKKPVD